MGPAVMGMLLNGSIIIGSTDGAVVINFATKVTSTTSFLDPFRLMATAAIAYFLAAYVPLAMGGKIMAMIDSGAKGLLKMGGKMGATGILRGAKGITGLGSGIADGMDPDSNSRSGKFFKRLHSATPKSFKHGASMWEQYRKGKEENIWEKSGQSLLDMTNSRYGTNEKAGLSKKLKEAGDVAALEDKDTWKRKANDKRLPTHIREASLIQMAKAQTIEQKDVETAFNDLGEQAGIRLALECRKGNPQFFGPDFFENINDETMRAKIQKNPLLNTNEILEKYSPDEKLELAPAMLGSTDDHHQDSLSRLSIDKEFAQHMKGTQFNALMAIEDRKLRDNATPDQIAKHEQYQTERERGIAAIDNVKTEHNAGRMNENAAIVALQDIGNFGNLSRDSQINIIRHNIGGAN